MAALVIVPLVEAAGQRKFLDTQLMVARGALPGRQVKRAAVGLQATRQAQQRYPAAAAAAAGGVAAHQGRLDHLWDHLLRQAARLGRLLLQASGRLGGLELTEVLAEQVQSAAPAPGRLFQVG